jgi:hypothetical protein
MLGQSTKRFPYCRASLVSKYINMLVNPRGSGKGSYIGLSTVIWPQTPCYVKHRWWAFHGTHFGKHLLSYLISLITSTTDSWRLSLSLPQAFKASALEFLGQKAYCLKSLFLDEQFEALGSFFIYWTEGYSSCHVCPWFSQGSLCSIGESSTIWLYRHTQSKPLLFFSMETWSQSSYLCLSQSPHLLNEDNNRICSTEFLWRFTVI